MEEEVLRFAFHKGTMNDFIWARKKKHVSLLKTSLQRKLDLRNVEEIPPAQHNKLLSEFVLTVRTYFRWKWLREVFYTNYFVKNTIFWFTLHFLNEVFALVIFKIDVVPFTLQVFIPHNFKILQIRKAIYRLNFKITSYLYVSLKVKSLCKRISL